MRFAEGRAWWRECSRLFASFRLSNDRRLGCEDRYGAAGIACAERAAEPRLAPVARTVLSASVMYGAPCSGDVICLSIGRKIVARPTMGVKVKLADRPTNRKTESDGCSRPAAYLRSG